MSERDIPRLWRLFTKRYFRNKVKVEGEARESLGLNISVFLFTGAKLGISPKNNNNGENVGGRDAGGGGADTGAFGGAINAYDSIDGSE
jgi:hypothetical protein